METLLSFWTLLVMISFLGIVYWAYSRHSKDSFDEAAKLPFEDELDGRNNNG